MSVRIRIVSLTLLLGGLICTAQARPPLPTPEAPAFEASSYILVDHLSGQVLAERNATQRFDPASITKLMTAYIVFHELRAGNAALTDMVHVSEKAWKAEGSRMFIEVGHKVSLEDLLRGMIVQSGNDASIALAEHLAGGEDSFAAWMNQHAVRLGMTDTHYLNATGLTAPEHHSSARDIALLARALIREFPEQYRYYSEKEFSYAGISQSNRNKLLWRDSSVDGVKTGYTEAAGYCLVSSAQRDGMRLIAVVLGTPSAKHRIDSSEALLNYGFRFFETVRVASQGETLAQAKIWKAANPLLDLGASQDVYVTVPRGRGADLTLTPQLDQRLIAPVVAEQAIGAVEVSLGDKALKTIPLIALGDAPLGSIWQRLRDELMLFVQR